MKSMQNSTVAGSAMQGITGASSWMQASPQGSSGVNTWRSLCRSSVLGKAVRTVHRCATAARAGRMFCMILAVGVKMLIAEPL